MIGAVRVRALGALTALLFVASVLGVVVVGRADDAAAVDLSTLAAATRQAGSGRMALTMRMDAGGTPVEMTGEGVFTVDPERARLTMTSPVLPGPLEVVTDGRTVYFRADVAPYASMAKGKPWVSMDASAFASPFDPMRSDPLQALRALEAEGALDNVRRSGEATVRGVPTTCYVADVDFVRMASKMNEAIGKVLAPYGDDLHSEMEMCADDDGVLRRGVMRVQTAIRGKGLRMEATTELYDFGAPVDVAVPPADQVTVVPMSLFPTG